MRAQFLGVVLDELTGQTAIKPVVLGTAGANGLAELSQAFGIEDVNADKCILLQNRQDRGAARFHTKGYRLLLEPITEAFEPGMHGARFIGQAERLGFASSLLHKEVMVFIGPVPADPRSGRDSLILVHR